MKSKQKKVFYLLVRGEDQPEAQIAVTVVWFPYESIKRVTTAGAGKLAATTKNQVSIRKRTVGIYDLTYGVVACQISILHPLYDIAMHIE